jgi:hypothetical protein
MGAKDGMTFVDTVEKQEPPERRLQAELPAPHGSTAATERLSADPCSRGSVRRQVSNLPHRSLRSFEQ